MHKFYGLLIVFSILFFEHAYPQNPYIFTKGLMARVPQRYGREALYTDPLAYQLYTHTLKAPVNGGVFDTANGQAVPWQEVIADSLNRLRPATGDGFAGRTMGSYIYLTYSSGREQAALLNIKGNSAVYVNGEPHMGDAYSSGYLYIPVKLKKGLNEFFVRGAFVTASLTFPPKDVFFNTEDLTVPDIVLDGANKPLLAAVVIINTSDKELKGLQIKSSMQGKDIISPVPAIPAMSTRKVPFGLNVSSVGNTGKYECHLTLMDSGKESDQAKITIEAVKPLSSYRSTFLSDIDGSLQYYAVTPQKNFGPGSALFLSVHGAGVEAIGQARAYQPKEWGTLVAATNRRPRGFNWEDWGRLDALEVLTLAKQKFRPDPQHIYLTGHSMGGHGTWFLGATYPDKWAAIGACSGYPTLKVYGSADGLIPDSSNSPMEQMLLRSGNQSDVIKLADNYRSLGVYILHGDADKTVSVNYARQMRKVLGDFHTDMSYYEYPGGEHWFGDQSVDWKPLFEFFKWHQLPADSTVNKIDFITASPGISSTNYWASVEQQVNPLQYSHIQLTRNAGAKTITGTTTNTQLLKLHLKDFPVNSTVRIMLDGSDTVQYTPRSSADSIFVTKNNGRWTLGAKPDLYQKGPHRYGTFKDAFNHRMIFVYGTTGSREENEWSFNKARYDAETWYYRGNGAVDVIADKDFRLPAYKDRGVIIFGNKNTNSAWIKLLSDCPIQVETNKITAGSSSWSGDELSTYFVWPIRSSAVASVGVVSGTGVKGMKAANANQYFAGASGFPDFMIYKLNMLRSGSTEVVMTGFFNNQWQLDGSNFVVDKE